MPIFSKKSKSREREATSKPHHPNGPDAAGGPAQSRGVTKNGAPVPPPNGVPMSPAERTAQRAALMAASRKRMNSDTDYSINGSFTLSKSRSIPTTAAQPVKSSHRALQKQRPPEDARKSKGSTDGSSPSAKPVQKSNIKGYVDGDGNKADLPGAGIQKTPPMSSESPTLGSTPSPDQRQAATSRPAVKSGFGSIIQASADSRGRTAVNNGGRDARAAQLPRVDSGIEPKQKPPPTKRPSDEAKFLLGATASKPPATAESKYAGYVSRLDPGPSDSVFASPVDPGQALADVPKSDTSSKSAMPHIHHQARRPSQNEQSMARGRSTAQKPVQSPVSADFAKPRPQYAKPGRSSSSSSRDLENPWPYIPQTSLTSPSRSVQSGSYFVQSHAAKTTSAAPSSRSSADPPFSTPPIGPSSTTPPTVASSRFADGATLKALQANTTETSNTAASTARAVPSVTANNNTEPPAPHASAPPPSNHRAADSNASDGSGRASTLLPPIAVLEGYKVNKRGQILDEEGVVIGELFEGDLIDCVRQKVNAEGEVIDEFGSVVGRVRPVRRGMVSAVRYSEDSSRSGFQSPAFQRPIGSAMSSDRRDSSVSQAASSQPSRGSVVSKAFTSGVVSPLPVATPMETPGSTFIAELDASKEVEAFPVMDQSDIFVPTFGSSQRSQSPSQLMKAELPANERRSSEASVASPADVSSAVEPRPKKWASRYFDPGPNNETSSPTASRRNSTNPVTGRPVIRSESLPPARRASQATLASTTPIIKAEPLAAPVSSPKTTSYPSPGWKSSGAYKVILGPTLEDLQEEPPSRSLSTTSKAGKSTPNLLSETSRLQVASPTHGSPFGSRRASLQIGSSSGLGPQSIRSSYQPVRRSPLGNFEATPPGSSDTNAAAVASASVPRSLLAVPRESEDADAAPAPEIPKARARPRSSNKGGGDPAERAKGLDKRKSVFGFWTSSKKEPATAATAS